MREHESNATEQESVDEQLMELSEASLETVAGGAPYVASFDAVVVASFD